METKVLSLLTIASLMVPLAGAIMAQQKEPGKIELNVFRIDAAMVAARARRFFANEGIDVKITTTPSSTDQMRGVSKGLYNLITDSFDNVLAWSGKEGAEIVAVAQRSEEHTSELQSRSDLVCRLLLEKKKNKALVRLSNLQQ